MEKYYVIYDGNCNLCVNLVKFLESLDQGKIFSYAPMQDAETLSQLEITQDDCEKGMILISTSQPQQKWQGSDAAEEIAQLLPTGKLFIDFYRALPGMKTMGDNFYSYIRDNRYSLFGQRNSTYVSDYAIACETDQCQSKGKG